MNENRSPGLVGIYASPRQGGNTDALLDAALRGAEETGAHVTRIYLRDLGFEPCRNCGYCSTHGRCHIRDGMDTVYDALDRADAVLLAAPVYFCSLCAQAKAMIDRCQPYWARRFVLNQPPPKTRRPGGFVSCGGFEDDRFLACTEQIVKTWYFVLGARYRGCLFIPGLDAAGDAEKHPSALGDAFEYGKKLFAG